MPVDPAVVKARQDALSRGLVDAASDPRIPDGIMANCVPDPSVAFVQTGERGVPFVVRVVFKGDKYGLDFCLEHDKDMPLIEFYDARHWHTPFGQFVSRYRYKEVADCQKERRGIQLDGGTPSWCVDFEAVDMAVNLAQALAAEKGYRLTMPVSRPDNGPSPF